jgi:hypothetical protein
MPHYLVQAAYKDTAMKHMVDHPQPREDVVRKAALCNERLEWPVTPPPWQ